MEEKLKEIKEKITALVNDYDIEDIYVYIDDGVTVDGINNPKPLKKEVIVEVRI